MIDVKIRDIRCATWLVKHAAFCIIPEHAGLTSVCSFVECGRHLNRRNYLSGTYLESIRLKEARSTAVVNNRIASAATIS